MRFFYVYKWESGQWVKVGMSGTPLGAARMAKFYGAKHGGMITHGPAAQGQHCTRYYPEYEKLGGLPFMPSFVRQPVVGD